MNKLKLYTFLLVLLILECFSCNKEDSGPFEINYYAPDDYEMMSQYLDIPEFPLDYKNQYPRYYRGGTTGNFDKDMATLGRVLFYDKKLSTDETISCGSCHKQELAFADDVDFSTGVEGRKTARNSLALGSVFSYQELYGAILPFYWNHRYTNAEQVCSQSFINENQMDMEMSEVLTAVQSQPYYSPLFEMTYGDRNITEDRILSAIGTFVNSIGSFDSKYDQALDDSGFQFFGLGFNAPSGDLALLTDEENNGKDLYLNNCTSCHGDLNLNPLKTKANNGLDLVYNDNGIGGFTNEADDMDKFKVPTLRNIMMTAPYMHDGRFATIEEVLDHYSSGIQNHPNLDVELKSGNSPIQMNFTAEQKTALIAFLNTFTDTKFLTAERYSDPFR